MKKIKKVVSFILILTLVLANFMPLLNVKAEGVEITTDDNSCNDKGCLVTNTASITVKKQAVDDNFAVFKVLDTYYNRATNEMNYQFTTTFLEFLNQNEEYKALTVDDYFNLTSDNPNGTSSSSVITTSTLNKLLSKYATYIRKNNLEGIEMEQQGVDAHIEVESGAYLILPISNRGGGSFDFDDIGSIRLYGVMVGNVVFTAENNQWVLEDNKVIESKVSYTSKEHGVIPYDVDELREFAPIIVKMIMGEEYTEAELLRMEELEKLSDLWYEKVIFTKEKNYSFQLESNKGEVPSNAVDSVKNDSSLDTVEVTFPEGIDFDLNKIAIYSNDLSFGSLESGFCSQPTIRDGKLYGNLNVRAKEDGSGFESFGEDEYLADISVDGKKITFTNVTSKRFGFCFNISLNDEAVVGSEIGNLGNQIMFNGTQITDPYNEDGIEEINDVISVYTYGISIKNISSSGNLNGAVFGVYKDEACTKQVGSDFTISNNGTTIFKGVDNSSTYYLKQLKAPAGYKIYNEVIKIEPGSSYDNIEETGYYNIEITNQKQGFLPSTGGIGTAIYTFIGLFIITVGSIAFISYKKKNLKTVN